MKISELYHYDHELDFDDNRFNYNISIHYSKNGSNAGHSIRLTRTYKPDEYRKICNKNPDIVPYATQYYDEENAKWE